MRIKKDEQTGEEKWGAVEEEVGKEGSRRRRRRKTEQVPWDGVEKCDLVPRPGDIFSTLLIDF